MTKQPLITDATRQGIADAFWEMYKTSAIEHITVSKVVEQAHVYRSTFYRYFKDVYDVLLFLETNVLANISEQTSHLAGQIEDMVQPEKNERTLHLRGINYAYTNRPSAARANNSRRVSLSYHIFS